MKRLERLGIFLFFDAMILLAFLGEFIRWVAPAEVLHVYRMLDTGITLLLLLFFTCSGWMSPPRVDGLSPAERTVWYGVFWLMFICSVAYYLRTSLLEWGMDPGAVPVMKGTAMVTMLLFLACQLFFVKKSKI